MGEENVIVRIDDERTHCLADAKTREIVVGQSRGQKSVVAMRSAL